MSDKTQLEKDIERRELVKNPLSTLLLVVFLSIGLGGLGIYTSKLKQGLSMKEHEIVLLKQNYNNEKTALLNKIKECIEEEHNGRGADIEASTN